MIHITKLVLFLGIYVIITNAADHDLFKDCSRIDYCTYLRAKEPIEKYVATSGEVGNDGLATFRLEPIDDENGESLQLTIQALTDNTFRLIINEVDSKRYQLEYVLDGEPEKSTFDNSEIGDNSATLTAGDNKIVLNYSPLSLEFYNNDVLKLRVNGNRLLLENTDTSQVIAFGISFPDALRLYGLHEHAERLSLRTTEPNGSDPYRFKNVDTSHYELNSPMALYGTVPLLYGHGTTSTSAVFIHNAAQQWVEITTNETTNDAYFMIEAGTLDVFVFLGPTPKQILHKFFTLTGLAHLPQFWTLGYHQSRWNYVSQDDVKDVVANFTTFNFPLDAIWLDIDYTDGKRFFTWDPNHFGDPIEMQQNISATYKKLITIIDPQIKVEDGFFAYDGGIEQDVFMKNPDGSAFEGEGFPGKCTILDIYNPKARDYWASLYHYDKFNGSTPTLGGIWNDQNEPSYNDNDSEKTFRNEMPHYGGVLHRDIHNIYGLLETMATHQGLLERDNNAKRPFIITRSHFAGSQRYASPWTGDNYGNWESLPFSYHMCLTASISGFPVCGADVGGFYEDTPEELLQRWYQAGAWLPFYRAHADSATKRREPYLFSEEVQKVIREAIQTRYVHLPMWYTLFFEHIRNKEPIIRPLFYQYPEDQEVLDMDDQLLVGTDILVTPVFESEAESIQVYLPGGENEHWLSLIDYETIYAGTGFVEIPVDINTKPYFYRKGSIIVRKETLRLSTTEMLDDDYTLVVFLNEDNKAHGTVYIDDFESFRYQDNFEYNYLSIDADDIDITFTPIDDFSNSDNFDFNVSHVVIIRLNQKETKNGKDFVAKKYVHKTDANNNLLSELKIKGDRITTIRLK